MSKEKIFQRIKELFRTRSASVCIQQREERTSTQQVAVHEDIALPVIMGGGTLIHGDKTWELSYQGAPPKSAKQHNARIILERQNNTAAIEDPTHELQTKF